MQQNFQNLQQNTQNLQQDTQQNLQQNTQQNLQQNIQQNMQQPQRNQRKKKEKNPDCNCKKGVERCPLQGKCMKEKDVIYVGKVTRLDNFEIHRCTCRPI